MNNDTCAVVDFNNLCFRILFIKDVDVYSENPNYPLWRYTIFESIYNLLWKVDNVNEIIIAVDDKNSWRKSYFSRYKESRKVKRDKTDLDWDMVFNQINDFVNNLRHHMPFYVLKIKSAEADDIIGVITKEYGDRNFVVISNDEDYQQLCSEHIKIYNPSKKKYIAHPNPKEFIIEKCLTGQSKDDIFNVITPNDWGKTDETKGKRKPGFGKKSAEKVMKGNVQEWLDEKGTYTKLDTEVNVPENYKRNRMLMDFDYIPNVIKQRITDAYFNYNFPPPRNMIQFFKKYNMRGMLENYHKVEQKLMDLY